jgi:translation initiation factor IF-1
MGNNKIEKDATVIEHLSGRNYIVEFDNGQRGKVYTSGNMRRFHIDVRELDRVKVEIDITGLEEMDEDGDMPTGHIGRITYRYDVEGG